ncbi:hypothetical protein DFQ26_002868 [Actinomortierella ambigua]|nr:hypothetical protein DFQ26_002868 [Actinomortierella ambigua]
METLPKLAAAAHELELHELKTGCEEYACKNLTNENASTMLSTADENAMLLLRASALNHIFRHARAVLSSEAILTLDQDLFMEVVASDKLVIDELEVWHAVVRWALAQCHQNFHDSDILAFPDFPGRLVVMPVYEEYDKIASPPLPTGAPLGKEDKLIYMSVADHTNLCNTIAPMLSYIRFPLIPVDDFGRLIEGTGLLPRREASTPPTSDDETTSDEDTESASTVEAKKSDPKTTKSEATKSDATKSDATKSDATKSDAAKRHELPDGRGADDV